MNIPKTVDVCGIAAYRPGQKAKPKEATMLELTKIAGNCKDGDCPQGLSGQIGARSPSRVTVVVDPTPEGEAVVEIPVELLAEAARALGG